MSSKITLCDWTVLYTVHVLIHYENKNDTTYCSIYRVGSNTILSGTGTHLVWGRSWVRFFLHLAKSLCRTMPLLLRHSLWQSTKVLLCSKGILFDLAWIWSVFIGSCIWTHVPREKIVGSLQDLVEPHLRKWVTGGGLEVLQRGPTSCSFFATWLSRQGDHLGPSCLSHHDTLYTFLNCKAKETLPFLS